MVKVFCKLITEQKVKNEKKSCIRYSARGKRSAENTKTEKIVEQKKLNFFVQVNNEIHYLFSQNFTEESYDFFKNGVTLDRCLDCSSAKRNKSILKIIEKIPSHIRYIEQEYGLVLLRKTAKKQDSRAA